MRLRDRERQRQPNTAIRTRREHERVDLDSGQVFGDKTVVVFVPRGTFTATCCSIQVPRNSRDSPGQR